MVKVQMFFKCQPYNIKRKEVKVSFTKGDIKADNPLSLEHDHIDCQFF